MINYALFYNKKVIYMIQNQIYSFLFTHGLFSATQLKKGLEGNIFAKITY